MAFGMTVFLRPPRSRLIRRGAVLLLAAAGLAGAGSSGCSGRFHRATQGTGAKFERGLPGMPRRRATHDEAGRQGGAAVLQSGGLRPVSYTHLRAHETVLDLVCRLLL